MSRREQGPFSYDPQKTNLNHVKKRWGLLHLDKQANNLLNITTSLDTGREKQAQF